MTPPGLAFASVSDRAWARSAEATLPRFYWDWARARENQAKDNTPFTPATSTVVALNAALELILAEGLESVFARHVALGRACRAGRQGDGARALLAGRRQRSCSDRDPDAPGIDAVALRLALRDRYGITIAGGHGDVIDRLFRIGHIGYVDVFDITTALGAIELQLVEMGATVERGAAGCGRARGLRDGGLTMRVLVRESIADAGIEPASVEVRGRRGPDDAARGDHRPTTTRS